MKSTQVSKLIRAEIQVPFNNAWWFWSDSFSAFSKLVVYAAIHRFEKTLHKRHPFPPFHVI